MEKNRPLLLLVWELTNKCNMHCKHCYRDFDMGGYSELSWEESLDLIDQIAELKPYYLGLSGGEAILRDDWHILAKKLIEKNVRTGILTNGWDFTEDNIIKAKQAGIKQISISLDGLEESHDFVRRKGSYRRIMETIDDIHKHGLNCIIATSVNNINIHELHELYLVLLAKKVNKWVLQAALPLGNFRNNSELCIEPSQIDVIIDFAYDVFKENKLRIDLVDCLGYYNVKETEIRSANLPEEYKDLKILINGCKAGMTAMGVLANGNVTGCISLQDKGFIEGNIRNKSLIDIWNDPNSFAWNTNKKKENLKGFCNKCQFGSYCLSGCPSTSRNVNDMQLIENEYCSYNVLAKHEIKKMHEVTDINKLKTIAEEAFLEEDYQLAEMYYDRLNKQIPGNTEIINRLNIINEKLDNAHLQISLQNQINIKADSV